MSVPEPAPAAEQPVMRHKTPYHHFPCRGCGARLEFDPADYQLSCPHCGQHNDVPKSEKQIRENDYKQHLRRMRHDAPSELRQEVHCDGCGANFTPPQNMAAFRCTFCDNSIVAQPTAENRVPPEAVLPFSIADDDAYAQFRDWVSKIWFAPSALKKAAAVDGGMRGVYIPYWTYDCNTVTFYRGERGEHRYEHEDYYETDADGNQVKKSREVKTTKWIRTSGFVTNSFDDVLVLASETLPREYADALEPWDLEELKTYAPQYLSGFEAESYQIDLVDGFENAKNLMDRPIRQKIKHDIGGDEQKIHSTKSEYNNITYKYILLPIWLASYRYNNKVYRFMINGRTGEVQGERPYSMVKVGAAIAAAVAALAIFIALVIAFT